ncbi:MAG: GTPase Era [[Candidatus Thermochlorobacteriaceae] bacterium GBChlB]|nr:MAG: GTPase Era [[Candidatus Thermochlorobacteriaceae] bacterium GBChlB]
MTEKKFSAGLVTIVGEPNAGKSTLLNALLGEKLSIVTRKPQTTRKQILGIYSSDECQIVFIDTPGIMQPKYKLHDAMINAADKARDDADAIVLIIDAAHYNAKRRLLADNLAFQRVASSKQPLLLAVNKIDTLKQNELILLLDRLSKEFDFKEIVPLSALKNRNVMELVNALKPYLPNDAPLYPTDILSIAPEKFFVSELVREKIFTLYSDEVPYSTEVEVEEFKEQFETDGRKDVIRCAVIVERESQKAILIGKGGAAIKKLGEAARADIEDFLQRPVYLELFVKVRQDWRENDGQLKNFGYK